MEKGKLSASEARTYRVQYIGWHTTEKDLIASFSAMDQPFIKVKSLACSVDNPHYQTAIIEFEPSIPGAYKPAVLERENFSVDDIDDVFDGFTPLHAKQNSASVE